MYIAVLGGHPCLSFAELVRMHGEVSLHGEDMAVFSGRLLETLGGSSKIAEVIDEVPTADVAGVERHLLENAGSYMSHRADSKMSFGISIHGVVWPRYRSLCLDMKKRLKSAGFRPRVVFGSGQTLNTAQVLYNQLHKNQSELIVSVGRHKTYIARTVWVQDVDAFSKRDMQRPCRDMETGMLPPKLARIMVNLAGGSHVFDPFCGSGVILQEALLTGKAASGSDIEPSMIECARANLEWLEREFGTRAAGDVFRADARQVTVPDGVDAVVSEGYLGPIIRQKPSREYVQRLAGKSDSLLRETLRHLRPQLREGVPVCMAAPAWKPGATNVVPEIADQGGGIDDLNALGYNRVDVAGVGPHELLYRRPDQYTGRQLILLERA